MYNAASPVEAIAEAILAGSDRALSRGLTAVERRGEFADALLEYLYPSTGRAHIVGITGSPGSGKSTLIRALAGEARKRGLTVGVIAVDPSSPFSGGSILGDRVRMNEVAFELGVFIRSLATHGCLGGLSRAAADSIDLMDAAGRQLIFVETVGVGQDEVDIVETVHTVVVVSVPGLGDEVQSLKAGILEIANIHVVNKADREGANRVQADLRSMLSLSNMGDWQPPILPCVALGDEGISPVLDAIADHLEWMKSSGNLTLQQKRMTKARILNIAHHLLREATTEQEWNSDDLLDRVVRRQLAPSAAGRALLSRLVHQRRDLQDVRSRDN